MTTTTTTTTTKSTAAGAGAAAARHGTARRRRRWGHGDNNGGFGCTVTAVDSTIKQNERDKLHQGAQYNDKVRLDATTRLLDDDETDNKRRDVAQRRGAATRRDGTR
jgi:hypothetical protein